MITTQIQEFFTNYLQNLAKLDVINQNEHTGRTPLENLLNHLKPEYIEITHEGKRNVDGLGAPDFTVNQSQKATVVGYIENKKIDENLNKILKSKQIEKYQKLSENLILTDYLEWIWLYKDNDPVRVRLCESDELANKKPKLNPEKANELYNLIQNFYSVEAAKITTAKELAQKLARPSIEIKKYLIQEIDFQAKSENAVERDDLFGVYKLFQKGLFEDLSSRDFADGFAQMLTYSVFLAKLNTNETLTLSNVKNSIPEAFSLIKTLDKFLDLLSENRHRQIKWAVENILSVINNIDSLAIGESLGSKFGDEEKDPYIYFYEDFLREYDSEVRMDRGVYYTPPAVVQFIVNRVSELLEEDFKLNGGIKNSQVKILDFACGTGTFLFESYKQVLSGTQVGSFEQNQLIGHLLNNFYGFEIMISSYIISHLKLSQFLKEKGYDLATKNNQRIGIYLTNTLDSKQEFLTDDLAKAVAEEGKKAKQIKEDNQIIAIIGNPPYNSSSQNTLHDGKGKDGGERESLKAFHQNYKPSDEKNINSLSDDYIKFIAFAHQKINRSGKGIVGMIVNNSFLKGLTHRKMRNELLKDFDKIYVVDLHGNARIGETSPDGTADQNVFDIMQGVCIIILVKNEKITDKGVYQIDLYGKRKQKLQALSELTIPNSPLEGWQPQVDGVDANSQTISTSPSFQSGTPQRGELQDLTLNSLVETPTVSPSRSWQKLPIDQFNTDFRSTKWGKNRFADDLSFFAPMKEAEAMIEYGQFWGLTDIFEVYNSGVQTKRDELVIDFEKEKLEEKMEKVFSGNYDSEFIKQYNIEDSSSYNFLDRLKKYKFEENNITTLDYRPFDSRWNYYKNGFTARPSYEVMKHLIKGENTGLIFMRGFTGTDSFNQIQVSDSLVDINYYGFQTYFAPLYLYQEEKQDESAEALDGLQNSFVKIPNFKKEFVEFITVKFGKVSPEAILGFIYASMHSPSYRTKYLELLKIDFPRVNFEVSEDQFEKLAEIGQDLINAHLLKKIPQTENKIDLYAPDFDNVVVEKVRYDEALQRVYLVEASLSRQNSDVAESLGFQKRMASHTSTYFQHISPAVWNYKIGGYQVLDKYLKARKDRVLSHQEIQHIKDTVKVIEWTLEAVQNKLK